MVVAHILRFFNFEDGCFSLKALRLLFDVMGKLSLLQLAPSELCTEFVELAE